MAKGFGQKDIKFLEACNIQISDLIDNGNYGTVKGNSKLAPQGVYTYKITVRDLQGGKHPFVGHVTVIRENN